MILLLAILSFTVNSTSVDDSWVCKGINVEGGIVDIKDITFNTVMSCADESYSFTTDDSGAFLLVHLLNLVKGDNLTLYIFNPDGSVYDTVEEIVLENLSTGTYMSYVIPIHGQSVMLGTYNAKLLSSGVVIASKSFTVSEPDYDCSNNGFFCCPSDRMCLSKADSKYTCTSGTCCNSALSCVEQVEGDLTVKIVTDCVAEGLDECEKVIGNVYDYSIHGGMESKPTIEFFYRDIDVDCYNKNNVVIAVYDESNTTNGTSAWRIFESTITKVAENYYSITATIDYIGYMAVIKSPKCVPTDCFIPGFSTVPFNGQVMVTNSIKLGVCQIARLCDASADGICDNKCTQGLDPDCGSMECTSQMNDCCNPEKDSICDLDCAPGMDPDCADESYLDGLCYPSSSQKRGFSECDVHCTGADSACSSSGCNPAADGTCNPNCPKLSNGVGYLDVDCCTLKGVSITNAAGDCCNTSEDGVCDPDCIAGLDSDCNKKITCNPNGNKESFEACDGSDFGTYSGCASYLGTGYTGNLTCTSACKIDTSGCTYTVSFNEGSS
jgi:hypothetical protein